MNYQQLMESGVAQWNQWRTQNPTQMPDLRGLSLTHSYLFEINLMGSDLRGVDLRRACLIGANLSRANLSGANLGGAYLSEANLGGANLSNANLIDTQMANANLWQANLVGTCLDQVKHTLNQLSQASAGPSNQQKIQQLVKAACQATTAERLALDETPPFLPQPALPPQRSSQHIAHPLSQAQSSQAQPSQAQSSQAQPSQIPPLSWSPALIEQCQQTLGTYYIGPMATLILNDIITLQCPRSQQQFIELVAAHIPDPQAALSFKDSCRIRFGTHRKHSPKNPSQKKGPNRLQSRPQSRPQNNVSSRESRPSNYAQHIKILQQQNKQKNESPLTQTCIDKCREQLTEYYITPMAQMLIDDVLARHQPTTARQFVQLIADHLPANQVEIFSEKILS